MIYNYIPKREPAWQGLNPQGAINFDVSLSPSDDNYLSSLLQTHFFPEGVQIEGQLLKTNTLAGHYKFASFDTKKWVLHIKNVGNSLDLENANDIVDHLLFKGIVAPRYKQSVGGQTEVNVDEFFVTVTEYFSARHSNYTIEDVVELGSCLSSLHLALEEFPNQESVKCRCALFDEELNIVSKKILDTEADFIDLQNRKHVLDAANRRMSRHFQYKNLQLIHGDLSPGNVLFLENNKVVFCDFEDSCFSFRSIGFDIAMVAARFCLAQINGHDGSTSKERLEAFLRSYWKFSSKKTSDLHLKSELQIISDHFLIVMASLILNNTHVGENEWLKAISWPTLLEKIK